MRCLFFRKIALEWGCCAGFWQMVFFLLGICSEFVRDLFGMRAKKYYFCGIVKKSKKV